MNEKELKSRIKNALILLEGGHSYKVGDLTFDCQNNSHFIVTGWIIANDIKNITKESALIELNETKELFKKMTSISYELSDFLSGRQIEYCLNFDYGKGGVGICEEINGQVKWINELDE